MPGVYNDKDRNLYDNYNKSKKYHKLLAIPERNAQAAEFNELQSLVLDLLKRIGDTVLKDGNVVSGCGIVVKDNKAIIEPGKIYLEGIVHDTDGGEVSITSVGEEIIGVKIQESIITELEDDSLLDPATGSANHFHPGAYRVKQELIFTLNDPEASTLVTLLDGEIVNLIVERPQLDTISELLARRTFDESGNYVVRGFEIKDSKYANDEKIFLTLTSGKAYVKGYEVGKPVDTNFSINRAKSTKEVIGEGFIVSSSNRYKLSRSPVNTINRVFVTAQTTETLTRASIPNTSDSLTSSTVLSIVSIKQGSTNYVMGTDYQIVGNQIDWSLSGKEPSGGTNYSVTYRYKTVLSSSQYRTEVIDNFTYLSLKSDSVVSQSDFYVDYTYYLSRKDTIGIDQDGNIKVYEGVPADVTDVVAPVVSDNSILLLGSVCALPNSGEVIVINNTIRASSMAKIQNVIKRVDDLEYNQSITDLDNEALEGESLLSMRGIFTDGFVNFNKIDTTLEETKLSLDIEAGILTMAYNEFLQNLSPSSEPTNKYSILGNVYTCPYTEVLYFEQPYRTRTMLVNPYQVFDPIVAISISPTSDTWVNTSHIQVNQEHTVPSRVSITSWWSAAKNSWTGNEQRLWEELGMQGQVPNNLQWGNLTTSRWGSIMSWNGTSYVVQGTASNVVSDKASMYIRPRTIKVTCATFDKNENNIKCSFDGRDVNLTPINSTTKGSLPGSVRADGNGLVEASFVIPDRVPCGTKEVKLYSDVHFGTTSYTANGRDVQIEDLVFTVTYQTRVWDPLAQTFQLDDTCNITSLDIFVSEKDGDFPITVQLRKTLNGYPSTEILAEKSVLASQIKVSEDGSVPTRVRFDNIVLCEKDTQYAIVILTDSPKIKVHVAKLGERDEYSDKFMTFNPYTAGVLFSSSNAIAWTPHQDMDLKFRLYRANFESTGRVQFNSVTTTKADRLMVALDHIQPANTSISFELKTNNGSWVPYYPWVDTYHNSNVEVVDVRATMTSNGFQSPMIVKDTGMLSYWYNELDSTYISKNLTFSQFNSLRVMIDVAKVPGVQYKVYYATDKVGSVWTEIPSYTGEFISEMWECREYTDSVPNSSNLRIKLVMRTDNSVNAPAIRRLRVLAKQV